MRMTSRGIWVSKDVTSVYDDDTNGNLAYGDVTSAYDVTLAYDEEGKILVILGM